MSLPRNGSQHNSSHRSSTPQKADRQMMHTEGLQQPYVLVLVLHTFPPGVKTNSLLVTEFYNYDTG